MAIAIGEHEKASEHRSAPTQKISSCLLTAWWAPYLTRTPRWERRGQWSHGHQGPGDVSCEGDRPAGRALGEAQEAQEAQGRRGEGGLKRAHQAGASFFPPFCPAVPFDACHSIYHYHLPPNTYYPPLTTYRLPSGSRRTLPSSAVTETETDRAWVVSKHRSAHGAHVRSPGFEVGLPAGSTYSTYESPVRYCRMYSTWYDVV
jgi:hypothetical protein